MRTGRLPSACATALLCLLTQDVAAQQEVETCMHYCNVTRNACRREAQNKAQLAVNPIIRGNRDDWVSGQRTPSEFFRDQANAVNRIRQDEEEKCNPPYTQCRQECTNGR